MENTMRKKHERIKRIKGYSNLKGCFHARDIVVGWLISVKENIFYRYRLINNILGKKEPRKLIWKTRVY